MKYKFHGIVICIYQSYYWQQLVMEIDNKYKSGWRLFLIKTVGTIIVVYLVELLLGAFTRKDELGTALIPFHNNYFSFSAYYITTASVGSEFSDNQQAATRFVFYMLYGYFGYAIVNIIIWKITANYADRINGALFYLLVLGMFLLAFFFPYKLTVIDTADKEIRINHYSYWFIPKTVTIPFNTIDHFQSDSARFYDGYTRSYTSYLNIVVTTKSGDKFTLGQIQANEQGGTLVHVPPFVIPVGKKVIAGKAVESLGHYVIGH